ncbi:MAG: bifunctional (p)ppGpp synthetase/guanosine-3',5'-bis(diphosphate) 3'-pyrophosphohydrolase [Thermostichales cyanobacterium BF4_bins_65]
MTTALQPATTGTFDCDLPPWLAAYLQRQPEDTPGSRKHTPAEIELICSAFLFAHELHKGQKRKSGDPYIAHPVQVASMLRELWADGATIAAGFLHDVVEDTDVTAEEIEQRFGAEVRLLVEGVTKLSKFNFSSKTAQQAENFRRMFVAMAKDIRVIVVKLADRLHNMRTLEYLKPEQQKQIAAETMAFFAPLASRLGMWKIKWELEDLSFKYLDPEAYEKMAQLVNQQRREREKQIEAFRAIIEEQLHKTGLKNFEVSGRPKHLYSIYQKMQRQQKSFDEIYDLYALRVITETSDDCYRVLAVIHQSYSLIPGRFKDYISVPKPNGYQSLHTTVYGPFNSPVEIQIRTREMHRVAELGIAAHWRYKEGDTNPKFNPKEDRFMWLRQLVEWQNHLQDDREYLDTIHAELFESFQSDVYVFTPKGDVHCLPKGSCPIDFAYRIHTEVGNHCAGAIVNQKMVPLNTVLRNGDIVEILTQKNAHPSLDWINFCKTSAAQNRIRQWFKRLHREENIALGRQLLEKELGKNGLENLLKSEQMQKIAERLNFTHVDDLLASLGRGETTIGTIVKKLQEQVKTELTPQLPASKAAPSTNSGALIANLQGLKHRIAKCCSPLPGDPIVGVVTRHDPAISIHHRNCSSLSRIPAERCVPLSWDQSLLKTCPASYPVDLYLKVIDRVGVFNDILARLKEASINVRTANVHTSPNALAQIYMRIDIRDRPQLTSVLSQIRNMVDVIELRCPQEMRDP